MRRLAYLVPVALFVALSLVLYFSLRSPPPNELPSPLVGHAAPPLALPPLDAQTAPFGRSDLAAGHVTVVNVWASWCAPCREEAPVLAGLGGLDGVALYGLVYKDKPDKARGFLSELGNPFARIDLDADGRAGIEWGVYGVPENFIIGRDGRIAYKLVGPLTDENLADVFKPEIEKALAVKTTASN